MNDKIDTGEATKCAKLLVSRRSGLGRMKNSLDGFTEWAPHGMVSYASHIIESITAERDTLRAEVEQLKSTEAEIRADERAKVIAEACARGQTVTDWEGSVSAVSVDTIQSLHTHASRAIVDKKGGDA